MQRLLIAAALACLSACNMAVNTSGQEETPAAAPAPLAASGEPSTLAPSDVGESLNGAVSVVRVNDLTLEVNGGIKLFGTAGGDPAMNGLYTYIAFYENPAEGWRVFQLGDFLDYRILSETPSRLDLELQESVYDEASGNISSRTRHIIVTWTRDDRHNPPSELTISAADAP